MTPTADVSPKCRCGAEMVLRNGKYGKFYGCSTFPKCRQTAKFNGGNGKPEPKKDITWSKYQEAIFDLGADLTTWQHLVIEAGAGSGKTTVGVEFAARLNPVHVQVKLRHVCPQVAPSRSRLYAAQPGVGQRQERPGQCQSGRPQGLVHYQESDRWDGLGPGRGGGPVN